MAKKYKITKEQFDHLVETRGRNKAMVNKIVKEIETAKSGLNESHLATDAEQTILKVHAKKGHLTTPVINGLKEHGIIVKNASDHLFG
jgi:hypothetical protein